MFVALNKTRNEQKYYYIYTQINISKDENYIGFVMQRRVDRSIT